LTVPFPVPDVVPVSVIHGLLVVAFQLHVPLLAVMAKEPGPPVLVNVALVGLKV